jgi:RNA polymerase sigma factor (sigma-70 family)
MSIISEPVSQSVRNQKLYEQARAGSLEAKNQLIEHLHLYAKALVWDFIALGKADQRRDRDELRSAAYFAVVEKINDLVDADEPVESITAYMTKVINRALSTYMDERPIVCASAATQRRQAAQAKANGEEYVKPKFKSLACLAELPDESDRAREMREHIDDACQSERDREIVRLSEEGYDQEEIAKKLDICQSTVSRSLDEIHERLFQVLHRRKG